MSTLLQRALEKVVALPQDEQDAITSQILASLADEEAWKKRLVEKRDVIRRMAREALAEDDRGETMPWDDLLRFSPAPLGSSGACFQTYPSKLNGMRSALIIYFRAIRRMPDCSLKSWKARITSICVGSA